MIVLQRRNIIYLFLNSVNTNNRRVIANKKTKRAFLEHSWNTAVATLWLLDDNPMELERV